MARIRLDQLLVQRGLAESRSKAQALLMAGSVRVNGEKQTRAAMLLDADTTAVAVVGALPYVSRGGYKLAHALDTFALDPSGVLALDVGASTGGFTDALLQRGAAHVIAVDVGYGILDWRLRQDDRVTVLERTNIRYLTELPAPPPAAPALPPSCATIDVSFISLALVLPAVQALLAPGAWVVALVKPQFEAGAADVGRGGVVRDPAVHRRVLADVRATAHDLGYRVQGETRSPITGPAGNVEFLLWLTMPL